MFESTWHRLFERLPHGSLKLVGQTKPRHPRYVEMVIEMLGYACIANYLASYILLVLLLPGLYTVVRLEEKELRDRFGEAYEDYCREVPRFFPYRKGRKEKQKTAP